MGLTIVIPTLGRSTLECSLASIQSQACEDLEVLVIGDGPQPAAKSLVEKLGPPFSYIEGPATRSWGHAQRNLGMRRASKEYVAFMDDDDTYLPGALAEISRAIRESDAGVFIFRMRHYSNVIWDRPEVAFGFVSTQMIVVKNEPGRFSEWMPNPASANGQGGDFLFVRDTVNRWPQDKTVFRSEIIAQLVSHSCGK